MKENTYKRKTIDMFYFNLVSLAFLFFLFSSISLVLHEGLQNANGSPVQEVSNNEIETFQRIFCGLDAKPNSNEYVIEYVLPQKCEMPTGIVFDDKDDKVWYVSSKKGLLGSYDLDDNKFDLEKIIPEWISRKNQKGSNQVWDMSIDRKEGDIWFTDVEQNAIWKYVISSETFEKYLIPAKSKDFDKSYPISIEFDTRNDNIVYFSSSYFPSLWVADINDLENNTSQGISEIALPINDFKGIDPLYITISPMVFDNERHVIWVSAMSYGFKGQIYKYDLETMTFDIFDLPKELSSPWGHTIDNEGNLWIANVGSNIFYMFSPDEYYKENEYIEKFSTSKASYRIFGKIAGNSTEQELQNRYYTLPSFIQTSDDGSIWFNQQQGNKIAEFDPSDRTLIEYWIPSQNSEWGPCHIDKEDIVINSDQCGIANVLQFSLGIDNDNNNNINGNDKEIWFTEWTENKIGKLEPEDKGLPYSIDIFESDEELTIERGEEEKIKFKIKAVEESFDNISMIASGTFTTTGYLENSTGYFSDESIELEEGEEKEIAFTFKPSKDLTPGKYNLMIGAENDAISILKTVKVTIN